MAFEQTWHTIPDLVAAEDLSGDQYSFVVVDYSAKTCRRPNDAIELADGILQNAPTAGKPATVVIDGYSKIKANAAIAVGVVVKAEYVGAADAGKADDSASTPASARAIMVLATAAENDIGTCLLFPKVTPHVIAVRHTWAGGAATTDSVVVTGVLATDAITAQINVVGSGSPTTVISAERSGANAVLVTLDQNGEDSVTIITVTAVHIV